VLGQTRAARDSIPLIQCPVDHTAKLYAEGPSSPEGLAFSPAGLLWVAEESVGRVSRIEIDGSVTPFTTGLNSAEGNSFDDDAT